MNIEKIQTLWDEDSKLDVDNLHTESTKIPSLHAKYYKIYNNILLLKKIEENYPKWIFLQSRYINSVYFI